MKIMSVFGTRPEAIKMCPLVLELEKTPDIESTVCLTGQHRQMLDQVIEIFGIHAQHDLEIMRPKQTLTQITVLILGKMRTVLEQERPDMVLVHGDTTTSFAAALAAFYQQIPVGHVEAGLRTYDKYSPFPEEMNRCLTGRIAECHFAPTENNRRNLARENITDNVFVTGNTVIDAFRVTVKENYAFHNAALEKLNGKGRRCVLITAHRRENWGEPLENICRAIKRLAKRYDNTDFIYPVHMNPMVRDTVHEMLGRTGNIHLMPPVDVEDMHNIMNRSFLVMTDSGGLQEEAPAFGVPVLALRTETERPEAVEAGTVKVVGVEENGIFDETVRLFEDEDEYRKMAKAVNPYGDGHASERIVKAILGKFKNV